MPRRLADQGRWKEAAENFSNLFESAHFNLPNSYYGATLWARSGDRDGYRRHCQPMLERNSGATKPELAERTAKVCLLLPLPAQVGEAARRLAERAVALTSKDDVLRPYGELVRGLAEYRAGRFDDAIRGVSPLTHRADLHWNVAVPAHMVHAMSLFRLGRREEARAAQNKGVEFYRTHARVTEEADSGDTLFIDRLICEVLRDEAEGLFLDAAFPADPFAP